MNEIQITSLGYDDIIEKVGGMQRINERYNAIMALYEEFISVIKLEDKKDICINERVVMHAIMDYFTDITRLKEFHNIDRINLDKITAYECSWLLKRKVIQVLREDCEDLVYINEKFVLLILVNHLTDNRVDDLEKSKELKSYCDFLLYYLKYRNCDAKVLEMIIVSFKAGGAISLK